LYLLYLLYLYVKSEKEFFMDDIMSDATRVMELFASLWAIMLPEFGG